MSEENSEAARPPDDGGQEASHPHAQHDKDSTVEHDLDEGGLEVGELKDAGYEADEMKEASLDNAPGGSQGGADTIVHEVGHWIGDEEPHVDAFGLGWSHEVISPRDSPPPPPTSSSDKPRPRYFDGRFLAAVAIIGLVVIGGLVILLRNQAAAAAALRTLAAAQTDYNNAPEGRSDTGMFWFFDADIDLEDGCVDDYTDLTIPICITNNTGDMVLITGSGFDPGEELCEPVPVIRTRENEPASVAEVEEGVSIESVIVGEVGDPLMDTGMLLGMKTVDDHPRDYDYFVELVLVAVPDLQAADSSSSSDSIPLESFSIGFSQQQRDQGIYSLYVRPQPPEPGGSNPIFFDIYATIDLEDDQAPDLGLVHFSAEDDHPGESLIALLAFAYESDVLAHLPPLCDLVSVPSEVEDTPTVEVEEEPTEDPGGSSGGVCGDSICKPATENSDLCPSDCQCVDDGVCNPGEGLNCRDCGSSAGSCEAACSDSSQCAEGLSCAGGICWDACLCGGDCAPRDGDGGGDGGGCTGPVVCGDNFCNTSCNEQATCTVDCIP